MLLSVRPCPLPWLPCLSVLALTSEAMLIGHVHKTKLLFALSILQRLGGSHLREGVED